LATASFLVAASAVIEPVAIESAATTAKENNFLLFIVTPVLVLLIPY
jgi:hypothetical protein